MAGPFRIQVVIPTTELEFTLAHYNRIKIYRSDTGIDGTYAEITTADTRPRLHPGIAGYLFTDTSALATASSYYQVSFYSSETTNESERSEPSIGEDVGITAHVLSVDQLKQVYLNGLDLTDDNGTPYPDIVFEWSIKFAFDWLEKELDIKLLPTRLVERYDYYRRDYEEWLFLKLRNSPIIDDLTGADLSSLNTNLTRVRVMWPSNQVVMEFDQRWIQLRPDAGQLNIVPAAGTLSQVVLTAGGSFLPLLASGRDFVPNLFEVHYTAGFANGSVPYDLRELVGKKAAFGPLNIAGDLLGGAGIASQSISIDGLSQSFNTTSSATNAGYGARLLQYSKEITEQLKTLRTYYKGIRLTAV